MSEREEKNNTYSNLISIFIFILVIIFIISLFPQSGIIIDYNKLILLTIIVVLILSNRFTELQISGFLKLSRTLEAVQKETETLRNYLIQIYSISSSKASATANVNFSDQRSQAEGLETVVPEKIKSEVNEIEKIDEDPRGVFLGLIIEIETKLRLLGERILGGAWAYRSVPQYAKDLSSKTIIDEPTLSLILEFWRIRNQIIHGQTSMTVTALNDAIKIGEIILSRLTQVYGPIVIISPSTGPVGEEISINGWNFTAGAKAEIYIDKINESSLVNTVNVKPDGRFSTKIKMPDVDEGQHYIWVKDETTGQCVFVNYQVEVS